MNKKETLRLKKDKARLVRKYNQYKKRNLLDEEVHDTFDLRIEDLIEPPYTKDLKRGSIVTTTHYMYKGYGDKLVVTDIIKSDYIPTSYILAYLDTGLDTLAVWNRADITRWKYRIGLRNIKRLKKVS